MARIRSWLNALKKLFVSDVKANQEKREKKKKWFIGRIKRKHLPAITAPTTVKGRSLIEAENWHNKHALAAAIATAAAAEAALASAEAAVEVVRLSVPPRSHAKSRKGIRASAAITIQTAFRGYLARKALRALKGLVRLQAMVRGQAVRRHVISTLNGLQTLVKIQSQLRITKTCVEDKELNKKFKKSEEKMTKPESNNKRVRVATLPSKEDIDALFLSRRESSIKRAHRGGTKSEAAVNVHGSLDHWLGQQVGGKEQKSRISLKSNLEEFYNIEGRRLRLVDSKYHEPLAGRRNSQITPPRRSFDKPRRSLCEDSDSLDSPIVPNYMSATESVKARLRSVSLPKQGLRSSLDVYSYNGSPSPSKNRLSFSSINTNAKGGMVSSSQQCSPSLKGLSGPIKSFPTTKDLSVDSDLSFFKHVQ